MNLIRIDAPPTTRTNDQGRSNLLKKGPSKYTMHEYDDIDKEIEDIESLLDEFGKDIDRMDVPDGYFGNLKTDILSKTSERRSFDKVIRIPSWIAAAACLALAIYLIPFGDQQTGSSFTEVPEPILDEFYFDEEEVLEIATLDDDLIFSEVTIELSEEELAEYFDDNGVDIEDLLEEI